VRLRESADLLAVAVRVSGINVGTDERCGT
jgi:hypothetical protein